METKQVRYWKLYKNKNDEATVIQKNSPTIKQHKEQYLIKERNNHK